MVGRNVCGAGENAWENLFPTRKRRWQTPACPTL